IDELKKTVLGLDWKRRARLIDLTLPRTGFIGGRKLKALARTIMGDVDFGNLKIPFACVATDVMTGEEVVIRQGPVLDAVRASISLPIIFAVAKWQGRYLVDGVLVNPVPVNVLKDMGAGFIIAVNVIPRTMERMHADSQRGKQGFKEPNLFSVILQSTHIAVDSRLRASLEGADIVIEPHLESIGYADFHQCPECIRQGELAARRLLPEIKRRLQG
ncbi:MAG: patatin-like phospholipase family protein, partial [Chloroflexota bacterium]